MVKKPESQRGPQFARSANATAPGIRARARPRPPGPAARPRGAGHEHERALADAGVHLGGQPDRPDGGQHEHDEAVAQRPLRAHRGQQSGDRRGQGGPDHAGQRRSRVRLDQRQVGRRQAGYGGRPGDAVRLGGDQDAEGGREQPGRVGDHGGGQHPAEEPAQRHRRPDRPAPAVAEAVQERADQRRHDREREHRQAQEEGDLVAGLAGRHLEEERAGERDRHGRVAGGVEGVQLDQPGEPRVSGPFGVGRASGLPSGVAAGPTGHASGATGTGAQGPPDRPRRPAASGRGSTRGSRGSTRRRIRAGPVGLPGLGLGSGVGHGSILHGARKTGATDTNCDPT